MKFERLPPDLRNWFRDMIGRRTNRDDLLRALLAAGYQKRMAEDRIESLSCVKDVVNQLRVRSNETRSETRDASAVQSTGRESHRDNGHSETPSSSDKRHRA